MGASEADVRARRRALGLAPVFKTIDTCAAEFEAETPYFYSTYEDENESLRTDRRKVVVLGGGPNRIGQGIEFDYCCVHACYALAERGFETVMINCNPETVSTDYDTSDRLYFEPLTFEDVSAVLDNERPDGVLVQFGGQTPLKLARALEEAGYPIWGTSPESIDLAEDRGRFGELLAEPRPARSRARRGPDAAGGPRRRPAHRLSAHGPALLRARGARDGGRLRRRAPRALHGAGRRELARASGADRPLPRRRLRVRRGRTLRRRGDVDRRHPAAHRGGRDPLGRLLLGAAGLEGDAGAARRDRARRRGGLARALRVRGLVNIQFATQEGLLYVLEVNPRASRTVPFVSKAIGVPMARAAALLAAGRVSRVASPSARARSRGLLHQGARLPLQEVPGGGHAARPRDEVDRRGHGDLAALRRRVREGVRGAWGRACPRAGAPS